MKPVPIDVAKQIIELSEEGYGVNNIAMFTSINSSTVKRVIQGKHKTYSDELSVRQIQQSLMNLFRPLNSTRKW